MAYIMNESEKTDRARIKAIHKKLRAPLRGGKSGDRYDYLAWAFARGFKFRRCERSHHTQTLENGEVFEHHMPVEYVLWAKLVRAGIFTCDKSLPENNWSTETQVLWCNAKADAATLRAWLADLSGAIEAPVVKPKKPYAPVAA